MKKLLILFIAFCVNATVFSQNGTIVNRQKFNWQDNARLAQRISDKGVLKPKYHYLNDVTIEKITYLSDGLKVKGYLVTPNKKGHYPCIIYNRGGNKEFGKLNPFKAVFILARVASWGYTVAASQYRGNDGGEGKEEFGGKDVDDILNLIPLFDKVKNTDTSKMGIYGWSRGGMMTYLTLTKTNKFKAAVVGGGLSDLVKWPSTRNDTIETVYYDNIPHFADNPLKEMKKRSAFYQVKKISKTTPILMLHGTADWRVVPQMALDLSSAFIKEKVPHRLVLFEGGTHGLSEFNDEVDAMVKKWFDDYLKNGKPLPDLELHGK